MQIFFNKYNSIVQNVQFEPLVADKNAMFKTVRHTLMPNDVQKKAMIGFCEAYRQMYNYTVEKINLEHRNESAGKDNFRYCDMIYKPNIGVLKKHFAGVKKTNCPGM